jgi:hypothetical protein
MLQLESQVLGCSSTAAAAALPLLWQCWALLQRLLLAPAGPLVLPPLLLQLPASLVSCLDAQGEACALPACCGALAAAAGWTGTAAVQNIAGRSTHEHKDNRYFNTCLAFSTGTAFTQYHVPQRAAAYDL